MFLSVMRDRNSQSDARYIYVAAAATCLCVIPVSHTVQVIIRYTARVISDAQFGGNCGVTGITHTGGATCKCCNCLFM
jgi:hypothetical protein